MRENNFFGHIANKWLMPARVDFYLLERQTRACSSSHLCGLVVVVVAGAHVAGDAGQVRIDR